VEELRECRKKSFTDQEVVGIVEEKKRFQKNPTNFAVKKHEIWKEKVCALALKQHSHAEL